MEIKELNISEINNPYWELKLRADNMYPYLLAESIKENGQLIPVVVWKKEEAYCLLKGQTILRALSLLGQDKCVCAVSNATNEEDALKIWCALNLNSRAINYIEVAKKIKQYPSIKKAMEKQTIMLQEEINNLERILDFDWSCFAKAKEQANGPDLFGGLDGN